MTVIVQEENEERRKKMGESSERLMYVQVVNKSKTMVGSITQVTLQTSTIQWHPC